MGGFLEILRQTLKIFLKNGKLIPIVTIVFVLANSVILFSYLFSIKFILNNFTKGMMNLMPVSASPSSPESSPNNAIDESFYRNVMSLMKQEFRLFALANSAFFFSFSLVSLLFAAATISVSAGNLLHEGNLRAKEIVSISLRSWKRTVLTWVYVALLGLGYAVFVVVFFVLPLEPIFLDTASVMLGKISPSTVIIAVLATILYFHLSVGWTLAMVVSVLEERSGLEALWRASVLVKGLEWKGFALKMLFEGLNLGVFLFLKAIFGQKLAAQATTGVGIFLTVVSMTISVVIGVFSLISFTVLYSEGKKMNDDNGIKMRGNAVEYSKVAASDIP